MHTLKAICNHFTYDKKTGELRYKRTNRLCKALSCNGYVVVSYKNKTYLAHRIIWAIVYGKWPEKIDHINEVRTDNRLTNLRDVSQSVNLHNISKANKNKGNKLLPRGVYFDKHTRSSKKYRASIMWNGVLRRKRFRTVEEARRFYLKVKSEMTQEQVERLLAYIKGEL